MKCVLCEKRKAKRTCPAKEGSICAPCCGEKRVLEVDCPETCAYLKAGREHESSEFAKRLQSGDPLEQEKNRQILSENRDVIAHLEYTIAQHRLVGRGLTDRDAFKAVALLLDAYRTEDKGVLYEKTSDDLRVESLRKELREIIEKYRNPEADHADGAVEPKRARMKLRDTIECLEFLHFMIAAYSKDRGSENCYVDFLARMTPKRETGSSIIMP